MKKKNRIKRRGAVYVITALGKKELADIGGQGRLIIKTLKRLRKATAKELRGRMGKSFKTKNNAASVIGVYLNRFRRKGLLVAKLPVSA